MLDMGGMNELYARLSLKEQLVQYVSHEPTFFDLANSLVQAYTVEYALSS
jgi:hypothetical protein